MHNVIVAFNGISYNLKQISNLPDTKHPYINNSTIRQINQPACLPTRQVTTSSNHQIIKLSNYQIITLFCV